MKKPQLDNARRLCSLNPCKVVTQLVTSQPDAVDTTMTFMWYTEVLVPSLISWKQPRSRARSDIHSTNPKTKSKRKVTEKLMNCLLWITLSQAQKKCSIRSSVVHFWRQWSCDQNDHEGKKPDNETRVPNPQSRAWLACWQNQVGPTNPNQIRWHQKSTRRHVNGRQFHPWWMESSSPIV